jgi:DNA-binding SARP family transcriptional activator
LTTGSCPRERLFSRLDQARSRPAVWLAGPGGAGKTTLVAGYLDSRSLPSLWYQVDEGDVDLATFFHYLSRASDQAAPQKRKPLPRLSPEFLPNLPVFTRRYFESLFQRFSPPFVLVFDDYQNIPADSALHEVIRWGIEAAPPGFSLLLVSREEPAPHFARFRANGTMSLVGWDEMRLNFNEVKELVCCKWGSGFSEKTLLQLHHKSEGWVAGLILMVESLALGATDLLFLERSNPECIADYFAHEIFEKIDGETRNFLLTTAFLPQMTVKLAEALTGSATCPRILDRLARNNLFTTRHLGSEVNYQYHQMFREFLQYRACALLPPADLLAVKKKSAVLLEDAGLIEYAGAIYADLQDWASLSTMALKQAPALLAQCREHLVEEWLNNLPPEEIDQNPWILFWLGTCRMTRDSAEARGLFEKAYPLFAALEESAGLYLAWSGIVDSILYEWTNFARLDTWITHLDQLLQRYPCFPSTEIEGKVAGSMFGALMFHLPQHPLIDAWADRIFSLARGNNDPAYRIMVGNHLALYHLWWTGNHPKLGMVMDLLQPPGRGENLPPLAQIIWICLRGLQEWAAGFSSQAQQSYEEGLSIANHSGVHVWDFMLYFLGAVSCLGEGDSRTGKKLLEQLVARIDRSQHLSLAHYYYVAAWQAVLAGEPSVALKQAQAALAVSAHLGGPFTDCAVQAALAQAKYACGRRDDALCSVGKAIDIAREINAPLLLYRNLLVKAFFALDTGDEEACLRLLAEAMPLGREGRYMNFSWWLEPIMARLCLQALEAGIEVAYVKELISRRNLSFPGSSPHQESWPWSVKVHTLGTFRVEIAGKPLHYSGKAQKKPLEMLKALIALGGEERREGQIADLLWPDAEGDAARQSLKVTLHRLREILGNDGAVLVGEGRLALNRSQVWTDAWAFEALLDSAQKKAEAGDEAAAAGLTQKALRLYRGYFLGSENDRPWAVSLRSRLKSRFVLNVVALATLLRKAGDHKKAIECCLQGLEGDALAEELYQNLMACYHAAGFGAEALDTFHRCRLTLAAHGTKPSARTLSFRQAILEV